MFGPVGVTQYKQYADDIYDSGAHLPSEQTRLDAYLGELIAYFESKREKARQSDETIRDGLPLEERFFITPIELSEHLRGLGPWQVVASAG